MACHMADGNSPVNWLLEMFSTCNSQVELDDGSSRSSPSRRLKLTSMATKPLGEDDFRSCCGDEEEWEDTEESFTAGVAKGELDEASVRLFFKGVSSPEAEGKKLSGIGVVMERSPGVPVLKVQKKLDFYVEELVAEHLALMDGLLVALQNGIRKIFAFTNSEKLYFQVRNW